MTRALRRMLPAALGVFLALAPGAAAREPETAGERYIVVYKGSVESPSRQTAEHEKAGGFETDYRYSRAVKGFAARLSPGQVRKIESDPDVAFVARDRVVHAAATVPLAAGELPPPLGIRRFGAATTTTARQASSVNVAVIDTGVQLDHPDLNASSGTNCINPGTPATDDHSHGTHVAGTIAARNAGGAGAVGVAPGTKIYSVKVLDAGGSGTTATVICGIDWVTANAAALNIKVANMSLGGVGYPLGTCATTTDPEHKAICNSTAAGVTYVVAAGNSRWDFDYASAPDTPAAYPEALTVTAMSDTDGQPGWLGPGSCFSGETDDRYAGFSNYALTTAGRNHTVAGPGVCVYSTAPGSGYATMSGTSMATPHVAGAVALCLGEAGAAGPCTGLTPAQIVQKMRSDAAARTTAVSSYGFTGDPVRPVGSQYFGHLAWAGAPAAPPPPTTVTAVPNAVAVMTGSYRSGGYSSLAAADGAYYSVNSNSTATRTSAWYANFSGVPKTLSNLRVTYQGKNSRTCTQTVAIGRWTDMAWVTLDTRNVGTGDVRIANLAPGGTLANYVNSTGNLRVRVRCTTTAGTFFASGNQVQISYVRP